MDCPDDSDRFCIRFDNNTSPQFVSLILPEKRILCLILFIFYLVQNFWLNRGNIGWLRGDCSMFN